MHTPKHCALLLITLLACSGCEGNKVQNEDWIEFPKYANPALREDYEKSTNRASRGDPQAYFNVAQISQEILGQLRRRKSEQVDDFVVQIGYALRKATALGAKGLPDRSAIKFVLLDEAATRCKLGEVDKAIELVEDTFSWGLTIDEIESLDLRSEWAAARATDDYDKRIQSWRERAVEGVLNPVLPIVPFEFVGTDIDGVEHTSSDREGQVLVINFWGTWREECREEVEYLTRLQEKYREQNVRVFGLATEQGTAKENKANVRAFIAEKNINYPCIVFDREQRLKYASELKEFPTTIFLDKVGQVRMVSEGAHKFEYFDTVVAYLIQEDIEEIRPLNLMQQ